jgi:DNA-binding NtrC family response regulator
MFTKPLPEQGEVVIGRAEDCDVSIDDAKLSRRHLKVRVAERIEVIDLGSTNGTFLRERRLAANAPQEVAHGDMITFGSTAIVMQSTPASARPLHVWGHGYFEARLEEECARAVNGGAPFAIVRIRVPEEMRTETLPATSALTTLVNWLRPADLVAAYAPGDYEVLSTGMAEDEAQRRADDLRGRLTDARIEFRLAVVTFPRDGRTPEALVERANALLANASSSPAPSGPGRTVPPSGGALGRMEPMIRRVAAADINVLILGETGVGKEVLARRVHELSSRAKNPLMSINCAALSESLLESELFGHEKGAFTGATQSKAGLLEAADGGSVFLDELGEMPLALQAKLLRVVEQREVTRVGALKPRSIDVRFLAATNRNLEVEVLEGRFRQDFYFRLNGIALTLPPLRERVDEIEPLARTFIEQCCQRLGRGALRLDEEATALLLGYQWPGNIRELRNVIERAVVLCSGKIITMQHLPIDKMGLVIQPGRDARGMMAGLSGEARVERDRIMAALDQCAGNQSHAAKLLGISRATLIKRIETYGLPRPRPRK